MIAELTLEQLGQRVRFSRVRCDQFVEACKVCLEEHSHQSGIVLQVDGYSPCSFRLTWDSPLSKDILESWADPEEATENGACAIAFFVVLELAHLTVIRRSRKKTGVDYWLAHEGGVLIQDAGRLEISGIRTGTPSIIRERVKQKIEQTKQSDETQPRLPAYVVVVEFSNPVSHVELRDA